MSELIQWPRAKYWDRAWNPVIGCRPVSPACDHCYAKALMARFPQYCDEDCFPSFRPRETASLTPPKKGVVFAGNMTDLFGEWVEKPSDYVVRTLGGKATAYLFLTKRVRRMVCATDDWVRLSCGERLYYHDFDMGNHYFGLTAEDQEWFERRMGEAVDMHPGRQLWLSLEPLLGPIDLYPIIRPNHPSWNIKWVVVGCESGRYRRPCKVEWVESIVSQCMSAGVPVFVKQLDIGGRCVTDIEKFPEHLRVRQVPWAGKE